MKYYITKGRGTLPLNNIYDGEFCMGVKCIDVRNDCYTTFNSKTDAEDYLKRKLSYLEDWITEDIPKQAELWAYKELFLENSKANYEKIKKSILNMKIHKLK